jgi:NhaP-type Na+/H+ or K+/H+ antiporter
MNRLWRFFLVVIVWMIIMYSMALLQVRSDTAHLIQQPNVPPLYDPVITQSSGWNVQRDVPDFLMLFAILSTFIFIAFDAQRKVPLLLFLQRLLLITGILYIIRAITISVTTLPPPNPNCQPKYARDAVSYAEYAMGQIIGDFTCTDLIFSGHTLTLMIAALTIDWYFSYRFMVPLFYLLAVVGTLTIVASRMHYTVDVVLSWILCFVVYNCFHEVVNQNASEQTKLKRPRINHFIRRMLLWFE